MQVESDPDSSCWSPVTLQEESRGSMTFSHDSITNGGHIEGDELKWQRKTMRGRRKEEGGEEEETGA